MSRTRAEALVLVNWKGVFYERYLLDRHVTALEGTNGAGKTTVMIAAYVVLLPDMSRLRFTNLGETGATGGDKGIWGRLGEPGRPSYTALDLALPGGRRIVAGVHLERKGEPSVEPTPFVVTGLADDVRLQDLLLVSSGDRDAVPELGELRENAARLGGRLQQFASARDYFAALFDQGALPMRLGTDEERTKLNEMLRTSMTGGISRALTSELRGFLLKEEAGLADTLQRMKANLDACRRTRTEVQESRRLEQEIGGVFQSGQAMFSAALLATRERAEEFEHRVAEAQRLLALAADAQTAADQALVAIAAEFAASEARRAEADEGLATAKAWRTRLREALAAAGELERKRLALRESDRVVHEVGRELAGAGERRGRRRTALDRAQDEYKRAARGLADLQAGLEQLHRRADAHRQVVRRRREAEVALDRAIAPEDLEPLLTETRLALAGVDQERRQAKTRLDDAADHSLRHGEVLEALRALRARDVGPDEAYTAAIEALRLHRDRRALGERVATFAVGLAEARTAATRQEHVRARAEQLGVDPIGQSASLVVLAKLAEVEGERGHLQGLERAALADAERDERAAKEADQRRRELVAREPEWRDLNARARRIADYRGAPVSDRADLDRVRAYLAEQVATTIRTEETTRETQERQVREARELLAAGGPFEADLLRLKDQLGAELVAASFEDVDLDAAGALEARLGPLAQALVVDDPVVAARAAEGRATSLPDLWLVPRDAQVDDVAATSADTMTTGGDVLVQERHALRVSRIPARPRLGRRARAARASELRAEVEAREIVLDELRAQRRQLERLAEDGEALLAGSLVWLAGDPGPELVLVQRRIEASTLQATEHRAQARRHADAARTLQPRIDGLRDLLGDALLLDPPDHAVRATALEADHDAARTARAEVTRAEPFAAIVDDGVAVLRQPPMSEESHAALRATFVSLSGERERLDAAAEALAYVREHHEALGWADAEERLAAEQALVPALEGQLGEATEAMTVAQQALDEAERDHAAILARSQVADAKHASAVEQVGAADEQFRAFDIPEPTQADLERAVEQVGRLEVDAKRLGDLRDELLKAHGRHEGACEDARQKARAADADLARERRDAVPAIERWERIRALALKHDLIGGGLLRGHDPASELHGHVNLVQEARAQRSILLERLGHAQGGAELRAALELLRDPSEGEFAEACLEAWLAVRDWLRRRLPAQIAEVDDPREALLRLKDQLSSLEVRLERQEQDLRGASEDVARGIEVQIRKARGQVTRLNRNLDGVSFGSIQEIRVRLLPVERMEQVLRALRDGAAQGLLFQDGLPIEEALDEIFRRYGGGRAGGHRLLDYREYVHLQVEIRRKAGADWEVANPTRLSTGEAIGVGAALMMVVLTEWERDANLLRGKKAHGSLRFLFLDEANRLSHDNLGVLFDLCQTLDLQLLIAAPEVARAEGNTTYRLVRRNLPDGREEVVVHGRRTRSA